MLDDRITDPTEIDRSAIRVILQAGRTPTIQFSEPGYDQKLLAEVDDLCRIHAEKIEVRFYGHYSSTFDAAWLSYIPNVRWLSLDCLYGITSLEHLSRLQHLRSLSLGIHELDVPDILSSLNLENLTDLRICETRKASIDLSPLVKCQKLERLHLASHTKGFSCLSELGQLKSLNLASIPKKQSLEVLAQIRNLKKLGIVLGGRTDFDEVSHPILEELSVVRVLGLSTLGDLGRFPSLRTLTVEDQLRLTSIDTAKMPRELRELKLANCKNLRLDASLGHLKKLEELVLARTATDLDALLASALPASLHAFRIWTGKRKLDELYRGKLDALGYAEFPSMASSA